MMIVISIDKIIILTMIIETFIDKVLTIMIININLLIIMIIMMVLHNKIMIQDKDIHKVHKTLIRDKGKIMILSKALHITMIRNVHLQAMIQGKINIAKILIQDRAPLHHIMMRVYILETLIKFFSEVSIQDDLLHKYTIDKDHLQIMIKVHPRIMILGKDHHHVMVHKISTKDKVLIPRPMIRDRVLPLNTLNNNMYPIKDHHMTLIQGKGLLPSIMTMVLRFLIKDME